MKSCVLTLALIWNHPGPYTLYYDGVMSILLKAKKDLWFSWNSGLVRPIALKFLPETYLSRITHPWNFQLKRPILSRKSFLRGEGTPLSIIFPFSSLWLLSHVRLYRTFREIPIYQSEKSCLSHYSSSDSSIYHDKIK